MTGLAPVNRAGGASRYHQVAALAISVLLVGTLIARTSSAAFTAEHSNPGNEFSAAELELNGDDSGQAMFDVSNMVPGLPAEACITITYTGGADADVKLYAGEVTGDLAPYLDVAIERDDDAGGEFGDCTGFDSDATIYDGTLEAFGTAAIDFDTGVGQWTASDADAVTYRVTAELQSDNAAQGLSSELTLTWEAQTTS